MCCRACAGYEICQNKAQLRDDCCPQCKYFDSCMESPDDEENVRQRINPTKKRYPKK